MAKLVFTHKHFAGRVYEFAVEMTTVGRAPDNTLIIDDESVSAHHCVILVNGPEVIVRELGSTNGTYVGGTRVAGQRPVHSGQTVRFGSVEARIEVEEASELDTATDITAIHAHARFKREAAAEQTAPPPAKRSEPPAVSNSAQDTWLLPKTASAPGTPAPASSAPSPPPPVGQSKARVRFGIATVAIALLVVILYLVFRRG
jgi:hypothetical protein